jgi:NitT/TauT family transport system ATP-binding protein
MAGDSLLPWRTALDNVCYGMELRGMPRVSRERQARALLEQVGLKGFEQSFPKALSQGMRQRCALARCFALEAPVLAMDEPFGALDALTKIQLEDVLLTLWERSRPTVLYVTHDLVEAVALADRVLVMSARPGRIAADIRIELKRPRVAHALQHDADFLSMYSSVWQALQRHSPIGSAVAR